MQEQYLEDQKSLIVGIYQSMHSQLNSLRKIHMDLPSIMLALLLEDEKRAGRMPQEALEVFGWISMPEQESNI